MEVWLVISESKYRLTIDRCILFTQWNVKRIASNIQQPNLLSLEHISLHTPRQKYWAKHVRTRTSQSNLQGNWFWYCNVQDLRTPLYLVVGSLNSSFRNPRRIFSLRWWQVLWRWCISWDLYLKQLINSHTCHAYMQLFLLMIRKYASIHDSSDPMNCINILKVDSNTNVCIDFE